MKLSYFVFHVCIHKNNIVWILSNSVYTKEFKPKKNDIVFLTAGKYYWLIIVIYYSFFNLKIFVSLDLNIISWKRMDVNL